MDQKELSDNIFAEVLYNTQVYLDSNETVGVYISGGIDSTIILKHLVDLTPVSNNRLIAYAANFGLEKNECEAQIKIAKHFGVQLKIVDIYDLYETLPKALTILDHPRFNVWPYYLARKAWVDGCKKIFLGEGADEIFGGYAKKSYLEAWADSIVYIQSTYRQIHDCFHIEVCMPFMDMSWRKYLPIHENPNKYHLRKAYENVFTKGILNTMVAGPPVYTNYKALWEKEFQPHVGGAPKTDFEAREMIKLETTRIWLLMQQRTKALEVTMGDFRYAE